MDAKFKLVGTFGVEGWGRSKQEWVHEKLQLCHYVLLD